MIYILHYHDTISQEISQWLNSRWTPYIINGIKNILLNFVIYFANQESRFSIIKIGIIEII